jgi:transposase-like protein
MVGPPGAQRYACAVCGRDFATQGALRIHSNVHAVKNFACTFPGCKKAFAGE